jgi:hypothetical protein
MRSSHLFGLTLATSLIALGSALTVLPAASADPADPADVTQTDAPAPGPGAGLATRSMPVADDAGVPAQAACKQFGAAMAYAATNYEDFAYATAGNGSYVNYGDPSVTNTNTIGRSALEKAAAVALSASATPGLQPELAGPMQAYSMGVAKLAVIMLAQGNGDALNQAATEVNQDAHNAQMACAQAGTPA